MGLEGSLIVCITTDFAKERELSQLLDGHGDVRFFTSADVASRFLSNGNNEVSDDRQDVDVLIKTFDGGELVIDVARQEVTWCGVELPLTQLERSIMDCLSRPPQRMWGYAELYNRVWGGTYYGDASPVRASVKRLRGKLRRAHVDVEVQTVRGLGYRLVPT